MIRMPLVLLVIITLSSCGVTGRFSEDDEVNLINRNVYPATQIDYKGLTAYTGGMFGEFVAMMKPLYLLDIPISLVVDTIMLPYDIGMYAYNSHYLSYWNDISSTKKIKKPMPEYIEHYNETGAAAMLSVMRNFNEEELLKFYFDVATTDDTWLKTSTKIINSVVTIAGHKEEYNLLRTYTCNVIASNLANKKFDHAINNIIDGKNHSADCIENLANNGLTCHFLVRNNHITEKHIRHCFNEAPVLFINHLSERSSTPVDIQNFMYNYAKMKISKSRIPLDKIMANDVSFIVLLNIAGVTKDINLINKLFELNSKHITSKLLYNPNVPVKDKLTYDDFRRNMAIDKEFSSKNELIEIIKVYPHDKELVINIASGHRIDIDVYEAIIKYTPSILRADIYSAIISNDTANKEGVLFKLVLADDVRSLVTDKDYSMLLSYTEIPVVNIINYGALEFIVHHPENHTQSSLLDPVKSKLPGRWVVRKDQTTDIKMEKGAIFGVHFEVKKLLSTYPVDLSTGFIIPIDSPKSLIEETKPDSDDEGFHINTEYVVYQSLSSDTEMVAGDWTFKAIYKDKLLAKMTFNLH